MFYLFILESIGTSELLLIGLVALIIFGPRKLPEVARTIGKTMAELRRSTDEFKKTWEQEVSFDGGKNGFENPLISLLQSTTAVENTIGRNNDLKENKIISPEIKEVDRPEFVQNLSVNEIQETNRPKVERAPTNKSDWL